MGWGKTKSKEFGTENSNVKSLEKRRKTRAVEVNVKWIKEVVRYILYVDKMMEKLGMIQNETDENRKGFRIALFCQELFIQ